MIFRSVHDHVYCSYRLQLPEGPFPPLAQAGGAVLAPHAHQAQSSAAGRGDNRVAYAGALRSKKGEGTRSAQVAQGKLPPLLGGWGQAGAACKEILPFHQEGPSSVLVVSGQKNPTKSGNKSVTKD